MDTDPTAPDSAPATAPDGVLDPPARVPPTAVALLPAPEPAPEPGRPLSDYLLAAPLGATKTLLDLTDAAADWLAGVLGLRRDVS